jgi:hypothetical protein
LTGRRPVFEIGQLKAAEHDVVSIPKELILNACAVDHDAIAAAEVVDPAGTRDHVEGHAGMATRNGGHVHGDVTVGASPDDHLRRHRIDANVAFVGGSVVIGQSSHILVVPLEA